MAVEQFLHTVGWRWAAVDDCAAVLCASVRVDASGSVADCLQPGDIFVVPFSAEADDCGPGVWYLLTGLGCIAMANGRSRSLPGRWASLSGAGQLLVAGILLRWLRRRNRHEGEVPHPMKDVLRMRGWTA